MPSTNSHQLEQLASSVATLRLGKYADFSIRCSDDTIIRAHRALVCPRSRVLAAAIDGKFREAMSQEIYLEDDEPLIVAKMVDFLYSLDYDDHRSEVRSSIIGIDDSVPSQKMQGRAGSDGQSAELESDDRDEPTGHNPFALVINAKAYVIADKYDIQGMKDWAAKKYQDVLPTTWNSSAFSESARIIYDKTPDNDRVLRKVITRKATEGIKVLLDRGEFMDLARSHGDLATEVLRSVVRESVQRQEEQVARTDSWSYAFNKKEKLRVR